MNNLHDVLELCLREVENGAELESVLSRYPEQAEELRPILSAAAHARRKAVSAPPEEVVRRNRARLLQQAARLREEKHKPFAGFLSFQKWATAFALLFVFLFAGTRLVIASADALPGDGLYPLKRLRENASLILTLNEERRIELQTRYADERLREIEQLFAQGLSAEVEFTGVVMSQRGDAWDVAGIAVFVTAQTELPVESVQVSAVVRVQGVTRAGFVLANRIEFLPVGAALSGFEVIKPTATSTPPGGEAGFGSASETPSPTVTPSSTPTVTPASASGNSNVNSNHNDNANSNDDDNDNDARDDDDGNNSNDDDDNNNNGG